MISLTQVWRIRLHPFGEVATHDVLKQHLQGLKDVEINIDNLPSFEQESNIPKEKPLKMVICDCKDPFIECHCKNLQTWSNSFAHV